MFHREINYKWAIFNSYVSLLEGKSHIFPGRLWICELSVYSRHVFQPIWGYIWRMVYHPQVTKPHGLLKLFHNSHRKTTQDPILWHWFFWGGFSDHGFPQLAQGVSPISFFCCDENALNAPSQELFGIGKCTVFTCMGVQCFDDFIVVMSWVEV